ncbi:amidase [Candidatus Kaiserbacteria bacterium]|nr:amidase [Candidatus Kaiserbacteria bacterium]
MSLENIISLGSKYGAWVAHEDNSLISRIEKETKEYGVDTERLFEGIPIGIKDIFNTAELPTQMGSPIWKDFTPGNDARAVYHLKRQGANVVGKTVTAEFAVHALNETLNPYDVARTPGTSSSGSAVAVALGTVPFATGTQTAGSIIRPASFCGIYGCKPSFGFIPRTGMLKTTDSLDTVGFFALYQEDLKRGFDALRVKGKNYPISHAAISDISRQRKQDGEPWKVAFARTHTWMNAPVYAQEAIEKYISKLSTQKNIEVVDISLPKSIEEAHEVHATIYNKSLSYYFEGEHKQADFVSLIMNKIISEGIKINANDFKGATVKQNKIIYDMDEYFKRCDVIISLSTAGEAPLRDETEAPDPALMWTLSHLPVVSVPQFKSPNGLPFGMQVVARKYNDYLLFEFLDYLQSINLIPSMSAYLKDYE